MSHEWYSLDDLARKLGRDRRDLEKSANRGRLPGRKTSGVWQFHSQEITHWLEQEMRVYDEGELRVVEETQQSPEVESDVPVTNLMHPETVQVPLQARTKRSVLECLVEVAGRTWQVWSPSDVLQAVQRREEVMSTGYENGIAIPHPRNPLPEALGESIIAFGRTFAGIPFGAPKRQLTDLFFLVLCKDSQTHLRVLARLGRMLQLSAFVDDLRDTDDNAAAYEIICAADDVISRQ
jgi:nitrogen PTS system EIIA component